VTKKFMLEFVKGLE